MTNLFLLVAFFFLNSWAAFETFWKLVAAAKQQDSFIHMQKVQHTGGFFGGERDWGPLLYFSFYTSSQMIHASSKTLSDTHSVKTKHTNNKKLFIQLLLLYLRKYSHFKMFHRNYRFITYYSRLLLTTTNYIPLNPEQN